MISDWKEHGSAPTPLVLVPSTTDLSGTKTCLDYDPLVAVYRKPYEGSVNRSVTSTLRTQSLAFLPHNSRHSLPYMCSTDTFWRERKNGQPLKQMFAFLKRPSGATISLGRKRRKNYISHIIT
ncbi:hypothetical protein TNCV_4547451 [Trichonephila clavipes]|nr:hypothetical protein TNCV_4547451 [Trichonephila clavipes]